MSKHTPGPWHIRIDDTGGPFTGWPSVEAAEDLDCSIIHRAGFKQEFWGELSQREAVANARLIAAAPDLLKALNSLRSAAYWIVEGGEFAHWVNDKTMPLAAAKELAELAEMVQAAQSLIDKATGETK